MHRILMEYLPGSQNIWVAKLNESDPIYEYETEAEAITKMEELQNADTSGRKYRVVEI